MDVAAWIGLGTLTTAVFGLGLVAWQLREQRRAMRAEFGNLYIQRYWAIDDDLLTTTKGTEAHKQHRHRYLRLFEDEFDVAYLGFFELGQWQAWHSVLDSTRALELVKSDLTVCDADATQFRRLRACVRQRERLDGPHPVSACEGNLKD